MPFSTNTFYAGTASAANTVTFIPNNGTDTSSVGYLIRPRTSLQNVQKAINEEDWLRVIEAFTHTDPHEDVWEALLGAPFEFLKTCVSRGSVLQSLGSYAVSKKNWDVAHLFPVVHVQFKNIEPLITARDWEALRYVERNFQITGHARGQIMRVLADIEELDILEEFFDVTLAESCTRGAVFFKKKRVFYKIIDLGAGKEAVEMAIRMGDAHFLRLALGRGLSLPAEATRLALRKGGEEILDTVYDITGYRTGDLWSACETVHPDRAVSYLLKRFKVPEYDRVDCLEKLLSVKPRFNHRVALAHMILRTKVDVSRLSEDVRKEWETDILRFYYPSAWEDLL